MTEATHFSQCVHDQQRRLEAEDCDSIRCAQLISGGRRRIRPPCTVPRSRSPHNVLHSPSSIHSEGEVLLWRGFHRLLVLTSGTTKFPQNIGRDGTYVLVLTSFKLSAEVNPQIAFQFKNLAGTRRGRLGRLCTCACDRLGSLCTRARDRLALGTVLTMRA